MAGPPGVGRAPGDPELPQRGEAAGGRQSWSSKGKTEESPPGPHCLPVPSGPCPGPARPCLPSPGTSVALPSDVPSSGTVTAEVKEHSVPPPPPGGTAPWRYPALAENRQVQGHSSPLYLSDAPPGTHGHGAREPKAGAAQARPHVPSLRQRRRRIPGSPPQIRERKPRKVPGLSVWANEPDPGAGRVRAGSDGPAAGGALRSTE